MARIAEDEHPDIVLEEGDTVIFSSRIIPGNERAIGRLQNALAELGVEIITEHDHFVHVSGHPAQDELIRMYQLVRPAIAVPVHGEARHLMAQARLAEQCQVPQSIVTRNGEVVQLAPGPAAVIGEVPSGGWWSTASRCIDATGESAQEPPAHGVQRRGVGDHRHGPQGHAAGAAAGHGAGPCSTMAGDAEELGSRVVAGAGRAFGHASGATTTRCARRPAWPCAARSRRWHGKRPVTQVHLVRLKGGAE